MINQETPICGKIVNTKNENDQPCTRIADHPDACDWWERVCDFKPYELCGKVMADGSLCTRYRYRLVEGDHLHDGACYAHERPEIIQDRPVMLPLVYLDTETGGIELTCSTIQVAIALPSWSYFDDHDGEIQDSFSSFVRPAHGPMMITPEAMAYNGIDLRAAVEWPRHDDVAASMRAWVSDRFCEGVKLTACGFNVRFDVDRIGMLCPGMFSHRVLDLTAVALFHGLPSKSAELIELFGDPSIANAHDALADARQARAVHLGMMRHIRGVG